MPSINKSSRPNYVPTKRTPAGTHGNEDYAFYNSKAWRKLSTAYRQSRPLCEVSDAMGEVVGADVTDHIIPISMGGARWDLHNLMALSHEVHNRKRGLEAHGWCAEAIDTMHGLIPAHRQQVIDKLSKGGGGIDP